MMTRMTTGSRPLIPQRVHSLAGCRYPSLNRKLSSERWNFDRCVGIGIIVDAF